MANTIVLQTRGGKHEEGYLTEVVKPGNLLAIGDGTLTLAPVDHTVLMVAKEDGYQGKTINDAYGATDRVFYFIPVPGDVLLCRVAAATYANGADLQAIANGRLGAAAAGKPVLARAEAVDGGLEGADDQTAAADDDLIRVRVV